MSIRCRRRSARTRLRAMTLRWVLLPGTLARRLALSAILNVGARDACVAADWKRPQKNSAIIVGANMFFIFACHPFALQVLKDALDVAAGDSERPHRINQGGRSLFAFTSVRR